MLTSFCLFISLIFYIIRKKNALETTIKVSCSIIYLLMFASVSLLGVSDWLEKTAVIQVIVLVQATLRAEALRSS